MTADERRKELYGLLGDLPPRDLPIEAVTEQVEHKPGYILEHLTLNLNGLEPVPALFLKPHGRRGPLPAVLYNHWHGGQYELGKWEILQGHKEFPLPPYGEALTAEGYAVLCLDAWNFGERRGRSESELFKEMLLRRRVLWGMMVYDSLRAVDYLAAHREIDAGRMATMGFSMGSTMAWWLAALDERIKVCVDLCCLTDLEALIERRGLDGHSIYYYVPSLLAHFSTAEINALIAPRPHLALAGEYDELTPPKGLDRIDAHLRQVYASPGAPAAWRLERYPVGHVETVAMRRSVLAFLREWL